MKSTDISYFQAIQWIWPVPILIGVIFAPESPWQVPHPSPPTNLTFVNRWLIRKGRTEDAKKSLLKLTSSKNADESFDVDQTIAMMVTTNELEKALESGTGYLDCFKGIDLRRTEIVCITWTIQNLCGSAFMGYSTYFYEQAGLPTVDAFDMSMAQVYPSPPPHPTHLPSPTQHSTQSESSVQWAPGS
jgi:SP family general alpha glucoside:H+ symporter-like MFS transporter